MNARIFLFISLIFWIALPVQAAQSPVQISEPINWARIRQGLNGNEVVLYTVKPGDTLGKIAREYKTTVGLIKRVNNLSANVIRVGQKLKIWAPVFTISISRESNLLELRAGERVLKVYPVSTGKAATGTPGGVYTVKEKLSDPTWYHNGRVYPPGDPENGLGSRWLGLDLESYGIHGTIHPDLIGTPVSAGCVRMHNADVEELFDLVPEGTKVIIN